MLEQMDFPVVAPLLSDPSLPQHDEVATHQSGSRSARERDDGSPDCSQRRLGPYDAIAMVLGTQIGSGIFISPSLVARNAGSAPLALALWSLAGFLAWACALCYVELAIRMPLNGGPQEYLARCFNDTFGFVASWGIIFALKPCSTAMLSLFVANYICDALGFVEGDSAVNLYRQLGALAVVLLITTINCVGNTQSRIVTKVLLACKILGLMFILVVGFGSFFFSFGPAPHDQRRRSTLQTFAVLGNYTDAALQALWAYSGWETLAFIGGELRNPSRTISRVTNSSMLAVVTLFVLTNFAYFTALSFEEVANSTTIAMTFSERFLGRAGSILYATVICLSALGTLNVKAYTAGRITQSAVNRKYLPKVLSTIDRKASREGRVPTGSSIPLFSGLHEPVQYKDGSIPLSAIVFNSCLTVAYILVGELGPMVRFIGFVEYSIVLITILGLVSLRLSGSNQSGRRDRPIFQVHWVAIGAALLATSFILGMSMLKHPFSGLGYLGFCLFSALLYTFVIGPEAI